MVNICPGLRRCLTAVSLPVSTWIQGWVPTTIADQCSNYSYRMPQIHALPDGRLLMTATRFACNDVQLFDLESDALQQPQMLLYFSEDLGIHSTMSLIITYSLWMKAKLGPFR